MRAVSALIIVFHHGYISNSNFVNQMISRHPDQEFWIKYVPDRGFVAADIFLLISGWLNA